MEQIAVEAEYINFLPTVWMPDFKGTFFIDSNGNVSLNHEILTLDSALISRWDHIEMNGKQRINMWIAGESFIILDDDALSIATRFFEKHLKHLYRE